MNLSTSFALFESARQGLREVWSITPHSVIPKQQRFFSFSGLSSLGIKVSKRAKLVLHKKMIAGLLLVTFFGVIGAWDLTHKGMFLAHDAEAHIARVASFYTSLTQGNIVPRWAGNLNGGFGHPIFIFLYPLPSYLGSFFHYIGFDFTDSVKLVFGVTYILSGITMYLWLVQFLGRVPAVTGAVLYLFAPYRFVDLYVRAAMGENSAFLFIPLVCLSFYLLSRQFRYRWVLLGSFSVAGLILAHNAVALMSMPVIVLYFLYLFLKAPRRNVFVMAFLFVMATGFMLSAFFWVPSIFEAKYTLRSIVLEKSFADHFPSVSQLIFPSWGYGPSVKGVSDSMSFQIGLLHWFVVLVALVMLLSKKIHHRRLAAGILVVFFAVIFLLTLHSRFVWDWVSILQTFQFPWRLLTLTVFLSSFLGALVVYSISYRYVVGTLICLVALFLYVPYAEAQDFYSHSDKYYLEQFIGTTDTGESAPRWSTRGMEERVKTPVEVIGGKATVGVYVYEFERHVFRIVSENGAQILDNTLYFPDWTVLVNGKEVHKEFQNELHRGLITFEVPAGESTVEVVFRETRLRVMANLLSVFGFFVLVVPGLVRVFGGRGLYNVLRRRQ